MRQLTVILCLFSFLKGIGQSSVNFSVPGTEPLDSIISIYYRSQGDELPLYNGRKYHSAPTSAGEYPFYQSQDWQSGSILYNNVWYHQVQILYDIHTDEVIVKSPGGLPIVLFKERVDQFIIGSQKFIRLEEQKNIKAGFYQQLNTGKMTVLAKRIKKYKEEVYQTVIERKFTSSVLYYVLVNNQYHYVKKQKNILDLADDYQSRIAKSLNDNDRRFKSDQEATMIHIAELYNQLSK